MSSRALVIAGFLLAVVTAGPPVDAQQASKILKVGLFLPGTPADFTLAVEAFRQGLREVGYVEGKTFALEVRYGEAKPERLPEVARELVGLKVDVIVGSTDAAIAAVRRETRAEAASFTQRNRLPSMYATKEYVDAGGLMSYGPSLLALYRRAATYVDKILKGAKPSELPVEQPTKFELVISLKTAKALGLTLPRSLLQRADQVIQ